MKKLIFLSCLLGANFLSKAQVDTASIRNIANVVKKEFAPDKRSVYFNVQFKGDTVFTESNSEKALQAFNSQLNSFTGAVKVTQLLPSKALNNMVYALANLSVSNNRSGTYHAAEMMTQMILGTPMQVLKKQNGYYLVKTPDGYLSWTESSAISLMDKAAFDKWKNAKRILFTADYGHAYSKADEKSLRVSDLVSGNILELLDSEANFFKVAFPDKRIAYVKKSEVIDFAGWEKRPNPTAEAILNTAKTLVGVPYLWGGTSVKGVDCSGFTKTSYFLNGIIIPRDASQQALVGEDIDILENDSVSLKKCLANLKAGDLLFFAAAKLRGISNGRITHTAIYMGNGEFIQSAGMVRINSLKSEAKNYDDRQTKTLVSAKRYLNQIGSEEISRVDQHEWYGK